MSDKYNLYNLELKFKDFLISGNVSPATLKNYLSDFRHFLGFMTIKSLISDDFFSSLNERNIKEYLDFIKNSNLPSKTINRKLSTLRKFSSFCLENNFIQANPTQKISNVKEDYFEKKIEIQKENKLNTAEIVFNAFKTENPSEAEKIKDFFQIINFK